MKQEPSSQKASESSTPLERLAAACKSGNGAITTVRGFKSHPLRASAKRVSFAPTVKLCSISHEGSLGSS